MESKNKQRSEIKCRIREMSENQKCLESQKACSLFAESKMFLSSSVILSYNALKSELNVDALRFMAENAGIPVYFPKVTPGTSHMEFYRADVNESGNFSEGAFGILEPEEKSELLFTRETAESARVITVIVPGLGFDVLGNRLGKGKGFYDLYLERLIKWCTNTGTSVCLAGICFNCQLEEKIPCESHDVKMNYIVTPEKIFEL